MGADIHISIEIMDLNGKWRDGNLYRRNPIYSPETPGLEDEQGFEQVQIYTRRDYDLFSVLAGVRDEGNWPLFSHPRGLPANATHATVKLSTGEYNHSHSYATLNELLFFDETHRDELLYAPNSIIGQGDVLSPFLDAIEQHRTFLETAYRTTIPPARIRVVFWFDG